MRGSNLGKRMRSVDYLNRRDVRGGIVAKCLSRYDIGGNEVVDCG